MNFPAAPITDSPVIDAHHHLWDLSGGSYPWLTPEGSFGPPGRFDRLKGSNYLLDQFRTDTAGTGVRGSVHIEAMWDPSRGQEHETAWLDRLPHQDGLVSRYVAGAPFGSPAARAIIERQAAHARVVGIRQIIGWTPDPAKQMAAAPDLTEDPSWRAALAGLREHGLLLELLMYPQQAENVADLARAHPWLQIVVNHKGSPVDTDPDGLARWRQGLQLMAAFPNIAIKLSAAFSFLPERTQGHLDAQTSELLLAFGSERVVFGSDFPVASLQHPSYAHTLAAVRHSLATLSTREQRQILADNAIRLYRFQPDDLAALPISAVPPENTPVSRPAERR